MVLRLNSIAPGCARSDICHASSKTQSSGADVCWLMPYFLLAVEFSRFLKISTLGLAAMCGF